VDLAQAQVDRTIPLAANSGATGSAILDDSIAYVANPGLNTVTRINYLTGDTASVAVGVFPQAVIAARGKVFVVNGNLVNFAPAGPSWLTVIDPVTNQHASGVDSIPLPGPGNAGFAVSPSDGLLYVMNTGPYDGVTRGRISTVDPVGREELGSFGGFGTAPGPIATNGTDRLYISSYTEGLMDYDIADGKVLRGEGEGIPIANNSAVAVDRDGRVYALETGPCTGGTPGVIHVLRRDLSEIRVVDAGECPVGAAVTEIPPSP
jgi:DNA-binding beta-propeller fold protein YncE